MIQTLPTSKKKGKLKVKKKKEGGGEGEGADEEDKDEKWWIRHWKWNSCCTHTLGLALWKEEKTCGQNSAAEEKP